MPYDAKADLYAGTKSAATFGRRGAVVVPSDSTDLAVYAKTLVVLAGGNLVILPVENDDGVTLPFTGLAAGQIVPFQVRRVLATGTTATVATVLG